MPEPAMVANGRACVIVVCTADTVWLFPVVGINLYPLLLVIPFTHCTCFQGAYGNGTSKSYELKLGNFLRIGSVGVVVSEIHTGAGGEHKCLSWEELTCLKGDIAAIQKVKAVEEKQQAGRLLFHCLCLVLRTIGQGVST